MLIPYGVLAGMVVALGLLGPWVNGFLEEVFARHFVETFHLAAVHNAAITHNAVEAGGSLLPILIPVVSVSLAAAGGYTAYRLYIQQAISPIKIIEKHGWLRAIYTFLWNRWYIDRFYTATFVNPAMRIREPLPRLVDSPLDKALNVSLPEWFLSVHGRIRKIQTGYLPVNMIYTVLLLIIILLFFVISKGYIGGV